MQVSHLPLVLSRVVLSLTISLFTSCSQPSADNALLASLDQTLQQSTLKMQEQLKISIWSLEEQLQNFCAVEKAKKWLPIARRAEQQTRIAVDVLTKMQQSAEDGRTDSRSMYDSCYGLLVTYRKEVLMLDEQIKNRFTTSFDGLDPNPGTGSVLSQHLIIVQRVTGQQLSIAISQLRYNVMQIGADLAAFCREQVSCIVEHFDSFTAIIGQNSTGLLPGQNLEIVAGVGSFSKAAQPRITIDGKDCKIEGNGVARFIIPAKDKPGKYKTQVRIEYINQDGIKNQVDKVVEWEVIKR